jgi:hypothetical protein
MEKSLYHIRGSYKLLFYTLVFFKLLPGEISGQDILLKTSNTVNYQTIFGEKYADALTFLYNNPWIYDSLKSYHVDPDLAISIVFPEIIRYSGIRDRIEKGGLFSLYIYYGEKYANFSIGYFQMKPSFIRQLETDISILPKHSVFHHFPIDKSDSRNARKERVKRLDELNWQVRYLAMFVAVMEQKLKDKKWLTTNDKLKFFAAAYNCGYTKPYHAILNIIEKETFHLGWATRGQLYCYANISAYFYSNHVKVN